ncbi:MAG: hypothetical protein IPN29_01520 [Saprospiraceae bacterium]|nr:hypothetical protein [Saprospiraceae bacterium]
MEDPFCASANGEEKAKNSISNVLKNVFIVLPSFSFRRRNNTPGMVGVGKLQAENVFSLFAMLKFGISADIIKNPIGPLMIIYFL